MSLKASKMHAWSPYLPASAKSLADRCNAGARCSSQTGGAGAFFSSIEEITPMLP